MRFVAFIVLTCLCRITSASDIGAFLSGKAEPVSVQTVAPYQSKEQFLSATRSGEIPEKLLSGHFSEQQDAELWKSILFVLKNDYGISSANTNYERANSDNTCSWKAEPFGVAIFGDVTRYKAKHNDKRELVNTKTQQWEMSNNCDNQFMKAFDSLADEYGSVVESYIPLKEQKQEQQRVAAATARRAAEEAQRIKQEAEHAREAAIKSDEAARVAANQIAQSDAREAQRNERNEKDKKREACLNTAPHLLYLASIEIQRGLKMVEEGRAMLEHDEAVESESGTKNITLRNKAGESIVAGKNLAKESFSEYIRLGGRETALEKVKDLPDPCLQYY